MFSKRASSVDCTIRDMSDGGARLSIASDITLPNSFELYIPTKNEYLEATLRWRRDRLIGISFDANGISAELMESGAGAPEDLPARVSQLESELQKLQRTVMRLRQDLQKVSDKDLASD